jgi:phosphocarrier protein HPr
MRHGVGYDAWEKRFRAWGVAGRGDRCVGPDGSRTGGFASGGPYPKERVPGGCRGRPWRRRYAAKDAALRVLAVREAESKFVSSLENQLVQRDVEVVNPQGLHARPVMRFVDLANQFRSGISVRKGNQAVDGKSPMEMILLEATQGTKLTLIAQGEDADAAVEALAGLVEAGFHEM